MKSFAWYDLQIIICSAIMMGYYFMVLRNKKFHQYNRFYILSVFFLSFIIPLIKIQLDKLETQQAVVQFIYVLADYNAVMDKAVAAKGFQINWAMMAVAGYTMVSAFFLFSFVVALIRIRRLLRKYSINHLGDVYLILTNVKGTPFSFFKYIFWNEEIDLQSSTGQKILQHELTHVNEKHSIDNIIVQIMMIVGWFNPFFWLARKELNMIHEFIADKRSVDNGDAASLAEILLAATYPQQKFLLTNSFFFSPIKRRLQMITNNKNPRFSYMRRVIVLPLMTVVVLLFAFRMKQEKAKENNSLMNSLYESIDTTQNPVGAGVSQAEMDEYETLLKTVIKTKGTNKAGKVITVIDGSKTKETKRAYEIWQAMSAIQRETATQVSFKKAPPFEKKIPSAEQLKTWLDSIMYGVWIDEKRISNETLSGYKPTDFSLYLISKLEKNAINYGKHYYQINLYTNNYFKTSIRKDTSIFVVPNFHLKKVDSSKVVITNKDSILKYDKGSDWNNYNSTSKAIKVIPLNNTVLLNGNDAPLIFVDGKKITHDEMSKINPSTIESINVLKDKTVTNKYGEEGKNGVILIITKPKIQNPAGVEKKEVVVIGYNNDITTKSIDQNTNNVKPRIVFTETEIHPEFVGGDVEWQKYLMHNLNRDLPVQQKAPQGKYTVKVSFIVYDNGKVSDVVAENNPGYGTAEEAVRVVMASPDWKPAVQNGNKVACKTLQTITFVVAGK
jgi:hypothetical protein